MAQKPSIPKGTRDFSPEEVVKRKYIKNAIQNCFRTYGYQPIETPSFEKNETLLGKYGEEGVVYLLLESLKRRYDMTSLYHLHVMWSNIKTISPFHSNAIRSNRSGEPIVLKRGDSVNSINVMLMW